MGDGCTAPPAGGARGAATYSSMAEGDTAAAGLTAADTTNLTESSPVASRMNSFLQMLPTRIHSVTLKLRNQLHMQQPQPLRPTPSPCPPGGQRVRPSGGMLSRCSSNGSDVWNLPGAPSAPAVAAPHHASRPCIPPWRALHCTRMPRT